MIVDLSEVAVNADPTRRSGSIRRTITVDGERPEGLAGPVSIVGRGRDLLTDSTGIGRPVTAMSIVISVGPGPDYTILALTAEPPVPNLDQLVGASAHVGLRRRVTALGGPYGTVGSLALRILQDVPAVTTLSRLSSLHQKNAPALQRLDMSERDDGRVDICAGWAAGSTMNQLLDAGLSPVHDHDDALAPATGVGDPDAWHSAPQLAPGCFRRRRRLDAVPTTGAPQGQRDGFELDSMFRDTFAGSDGVERVEHEYRVSAEIDRSSMKVVRSKAVPINLPAPECPRASDSASLLVGEAVSNLSVARRRLVGPTTCTHLTQALLAFADAADLVDLLADC